MNQNYEKQIAEQRKANARTERVSLALPVEDLNRSLAGAAGWSLPKKAREGVLAHEAELAKVNARIKELAKDGVGQLRGQQRAAIVAAAKADKPLPVVAADGGTVQTSDLHKVVGTQIAALKAEAKRICTEAAKITVPAVRDYVKAASIFVDGLRDAELEAYSRFNLQHVESPLVSQLREALRITAERIETMAAGETTLPPRQQLQGLL